MNLTKNSKSVRFKSNPIPKDRIQISSNKKELSFGTKVGIGLCLVLVTGLGIYNKKSLKNIWDKVFCKKCTGGNKTVNQNKEYLDKIDDIKENFSKIFGRDFTKDEANELALKYKEIFELENNSEFMSKIFMQMCKDYQLPDIPYTIGTTQMDKAYAEWSLFGGLTYNKNLVKYVMENGICKFTDINRAHVVKSLAHEMKHANQDKISNQADTFKNIIAYIDREQRYNTELWQNNLRQNGNNIEETRRKLKDLLYNNMIESYKSLEKIPVDSPLYQKGLEYIEGTRNYIVATDDLAKYRNQAIEKEAHDAGNRMEQIYNWLTNK